MLGWTILFGSIAMGGAFAASATSPVFLVAAAVSGISTVLFLITLWGRFAPNV